MMIRSDAIHTVQSTVNRCLWTAGLLLQSALLAVLVVRREARRFPAFTLLIAFYTVRTAVLYALSGHIAGADYGLLYESLSLVDLLLQCAVAAEIALHVIRQRGGWTRRMGAMLLVMIGLAAAAGWFAWLVLRGHPQVPVDRGQLFLWCLMAMLSGWAVWSAASGPIRRIVEGLALYGMACLLSAAARVHAIAHHDARSYMAGGYAPAAVYLGIIVFWLLTLKSASGRSAQH